MKVGAIILSRYNSSRLHGKVLHKIHGTPLVHHIVNRLSQYFPLNNIVLATSNEPSDDPIAEYARQNEIQLFRGSLNNVAHRFAEAAMSIEADAAIRINGDNLFIDLESLDEMIRIYDGGEYDFVSNVPQRTFPFGMSIEIVNVDFYYKVLPKMTTRSWQEHVTLYLYENETGRQFHYRNSKCPSMQGKKTCN
jgi:spore coat polysaccharide biosynthesis protein SpsF